MAPQHPRLQPAEHLEKILSCPPMDLQVGLRGISQDAQCRVIASSFSPLEKRYVERKYPENRFSGAMTL